MRAKKRVLKCKIEEDDKKHDIKGETDKEALEHPSWMSLSSGTSSRSTTPPEEQRVPCERCFQRMKEHPDHVCVIKPDASRCKSCNSAHKPCLKLPSVVHADVIRALSIRTEKQRIALIRGIVRRMQRYAIQLSKLKSKSTYGSSGESIEAVRDEILAVSYRTQWEVQRLTERLIEVEIEMQGKTHDQLQDELQDELQGEPQGELE
ncbi:hypothetical protein N7455_009598 [Penicillium solitum]|uniref:uncharacterized protein n=1 Tax=Penicillium solitum TaxID=60172 RepID=UPI0032C46775|nr:hypothetical protein N7455_009598 [Penicillium solitum]